MLGTPNFHHIVVAEHMYSFRVKYGMDIIGRITNGVDSIVFHPLWVYERQWPRRMMAIRKGNKVWFDGQDIADEAAIKLAAKFSDFEYVVVASDYRQKNDAKALPAQTRVVSTYSEQEMAKVLNSVTVYTIPSRYEGSSLTALEAMASGTPVVCTQIASDAARHEDTALIVPYGDVDAVVEAVSRIFTDEALRWKLYYNGLKEARARPLERQREEFRAVVKEHCR